MKTRTGNRSHFTLVELLIVFFVIITLFAMLMPHQCRAREPARRVNCAGNLKQIGLSLLMYTGDYDGYFPQRHPNVPAHNSFAPLGEYRYIQDGKVWACPSRTMVLTLHTHAAYRYIGSGLRDDNAQANRASLAYDESENHPNNEWMNVLFIDSHVEGAKPGTRPWAQHK